MFKKSGRLPHMKLGVFDIFITLFLVVLAVIIVYPFFHAVVVSFMSQKEYVHNKFALFPSNPTIEAYVQVFKKGWVQTGYLATMAIVSQSVILCLIVTTPCAYALAKRKFPGKMLVLNIILLTMFFTGGVVPYYIVIKNLGLMNSWYSLILPAAFTPFYMLLMRNFFMGIPDGIEESAKLDGAGDFRLLFEIIMPLSKPVIASVALFKAVDMWNEWYYPMLFITDRARYPLQLALRSMLGMATSTTNHADVSQSTYIVSVQMAAIIVSILPVMLLYPFIQKYFVRGIMVGAVKE